MCTFYLSVEIVFCSLRNDKSEIANMTLNIVDILDM